MAADKIAGRSKDFWDSMAWLLSKERKRHLKDIERIEEDLKKLAKLGIEIPDPDVNIWVEVPDVQNVDR